MRGQVRRFSCRVRIGSKSKADFSYLNTTGYFAQTKKSTDEQKEKFFGLLKTVVADTSLGGIDRSQALKTLGKYAPDGKAFAKKFVGDAESFVKDAAKRIIKGK